MNDTRPPISIGAIVAIGLLQVLFGTFAIVLPYVAGKLFVVLLGLTLLVTGVLQLSSGMSRAAWGRAILGAISLLAGIVLIVNQSFRLSLVGTIAGIYLIFSGISRILFATRIHPPANTSWVVIGGIIAVILGIVLLAGWLGASASLIGLFVGINILISGILTLAVSTRSRKLLI